MTTKQLQDRITISAVGTGSFYVKITYRGRGYSCKSYNTLAYDAIFGGDNDYYTTKQALQALWDECRETNLLG